MFEARAYFFSQPAQQHAVHYQCEEEGVCVCVCVCVCVSMHHDFLLNVSIFSAIPHVNDRCIAGAPASNLHTERGGGRTRRGHGPRAARITPRIRSLPAPVCVCVCVGVCAGVWVCVCVCLCVCVCVLCVCVYVCVCVCVS